MADIGHELTDDMLKKLEREIAAEYRTATRDMEKKLRDYLEQTEAQRKVQEKLWKDGVITKKEYTDWCYRHEMVGKRWEAMRDTLAADMHHTNEIALGITKGKMPDVYALNMNYGTYQIEHDGRIDTGFTLYNHDTANYLLGDQRQLMPKPSTRKAAEIAANKDMQWNMRKIQSCVLQGVLQGESSYEVAHRLEQVGQMNYNSAVRYARTMTTSAQNAGRYEAYRRADSLGVELTIEWQATLDHRTRHDHRLMHGQRTEVNEPFHTPDGFTILYPADCTGASTVPQKEIWNCRCRLISWVKGFEGETVTSSPKMGDMTYEEWLNENAPKEKAKPKKEVTFGDKLANSLGKDADEYKQLIENAPDAIIDTYNKFSEKLRNVYRESGRGYYDGGNLYWSHSVNGNKWETLAHEYGHHIDAMIPKTAYTSNEVMYIHNELNGALKKKYKNFFGTTFISRTASSSDEFLSAMRADRNALARYMTDPVFRKPIHDELVSKKAITKGVQDAFDGFWLTRGSKDSSIRLWWGHGSPYYNREYNRKIMNWGVEKDLKGALTALGFDASNLTKVKTITRDYETASELWANVNAAKTVGGETLSLMEKYFPNVCKAFDNIILAGMK